MPYSKEHTHSPEDENGMIAALLELMTPRSVLEQEDFPLPEAIYPPDYPNFDALLARRDRIRSLQLVPVKDDAGYVFYHAQSRESLVRMVEQYFQSGTIIAVRNAFPYALPRDVEQWLVWIQNPNLDRTEIADYIARILERRKLTLDDVIVFERPLHSRSKLVRGTFPEYRHVHLWLRKRSYSNVSSA